MPLLIVTLAWITSANGNWDEKAILDTIEVRNVYNRKQLPNHVYDYKVSYWTSNDLSNLTTPSPESHNMSCKFVETDACILFSSRYHEEQAQIDLAKKNNDALQMPFSSSFAVINKLTGDSAATGLLFSDIRLYPGKPLMPYSYTPYDMAVYGEKGRGTIQDMIVRGRKGEVAISEVSIGNPIIKLTTTEKVSGLTQISKWELDADKGYNVVKLIFMVLKDGKEQAQITALFQDYRQDATGLWFPYSITRYMRRLDGLWGIDLTRYSSVTTPGPDACSLVKLKLPPGAAIYLGDVPRSAIHPQGAVVIDSENIGHYIAQCQAVAQAAAWSRLGYFERYRYYILAAIVLFVALGGWAIYHRVKKQPRSISLTS